MVADSMQNGRGSQESARNNKKRSEGSPFFAPILKESILGVTGTIGIGTIRVARKYDSLQANLGHRFSNGLQYTVAYTFSETINWWAGSIPQPQYVALNKGVASSNVPRVFNTSAVYELPFGKGKELLQNSGFVPRLVGGWQVNAFLTLRSGLPYTVTASTGSLNACTGTPQEADRVAASVQTLGGIGPNSAYFDMTAFRPVTAVPFGTAGFNSMYGPGVPNLDTGLFREIKFRERMSIQFRAEALNTTNTPHFPNPAANVSSLRLSPDGSVKNLNGFGVITSTNLTGGGTTRGKYGSAFALDLMLPASALEGLPQG